MAEWIALDRLLVDPQPQRSIGVCDGEVIDHARFRQRVLAWRAAFAAADGRDWALYFDDAVAFAAALFGAWHAASGCSWLPTTCRPRCRRCGHR